eukprot:1145823-Pelagomonas_calceolata.AAC.14
MVPNCVPIASNQVAQGVPELSQELTGRRSISPSIKATDCCPKETLGPLRSSNLQLLHSKARDIVPFNKMLLTLHTPQVPAAEKGNLLINRNKKSQPLHTLLENDNLIARSWGEVLLTLLS